MSNNLESSEVKISFKKKVNKSNRAMVQIPEESKIYDLLFRINDSSPCAKWEILDRLVDMIPKTKAELDMAAFNEFIDRVATSGEERKKLEQLRPLIFNQILEISADENYNLKKGIKRVLPDEYFEELKKL